MTKTFMLMAAMTALVMGVGYLLGAQNGMLVAFGLSLVMNLFTYWNADKIVLNTYRAQPVDDSTAPDLVALVRRLAGAAGLPMPAVYIMDNPQPNAFATGRDPQHAAVCVTTGILERLDYMELAGVLAHELAHIKHRDTLTMTVTASLAGALSMLTNFMVFMGGTQSHNGERRAHPAVSLLVMILAPIAAALVQFAISRSREFEADRMGAEICGHPDWLADALETIDARAGETDNVVAENNPATAHLFIINPLHMRAIGSLFATHPSTAERVQRLRAMVSTGS